MNTRLLLAGAVLMIVAGNIHGMELLSYVSEASREASAASKDSSSSKLSAYALPGPSSGLAIFPESPMPLQPPAYFAPAALAFASDVPSMDGSLASKMAGAPVGMMSGGCMQPIPEPEETAIALAILSLGLAVVRRHRARHTSPPTS